MLVFVDESGDPGMKLDRGSSPFFTVALVTFTDRDDAQACDDRIAALRKELSLADGYEFHYSHNSRRTRIAFLEAVTEFPFFYHAFALDKARVTGKGFHFKDSLYKWTAKTTFENARPYLDNATVVLDRCGDRKFRDELAAYLRKRINDRNGLRHIAKVKLQDSHRNNLLQLADYVAGVIAGTMRGDRYDVELRRDYLATHEISRQRWPK